VSYFDDPVGGVKIQTPQTQQTGFLLYTIAVYLYCYFDNYKIVGSRAVGGLQAPRVRCGYGYFTFDGSPTSFKTKYTKITQSVSLVVLAGKTLHINYRKIH